jgi:tight adherence protein B
VKRLLGQILAACALAALAGPPAFAAGGIGLTEAGGSRFPERAFVVSLPSDRSLSAGDVGVTENGQPVVDVNLVPAAAAERKAFGVVLLIDASDSMAGRPLAGALAAASAFVARRPANQQIALITFNDSATVALPFTTSQAKIAAALGVKPALAYGTHIYDAVGKGLDLLQQAGIESGSVVLLSDGADTGSRAPAAGVGAAARAAHVRLFTIGLRSAHFDPKTLQGLASGGGGVYAEAKSAAELAPLYERLGAELSREYLLTYKSLAGPQARVNVQVQVAGAGSAGSAYVTPALPAGTTPVAPYHESLLSKILTSAIFMVVIALLCTAALVTTARLLLLPAGSSDLRRRMSNFVSLTSPGRPTASRRTVISGILEDADGSLGRRQFWARFEEALEIAQIKTPAIRIVVWTVVGTLVAGVALDLLFSGLLVVAALAVPLGVRTWVLYKLKSRRKRFGEQLPDSLEVLASALRAGHSLVGALSVVVETSGEPMKSEFARVVADEQLGIPLEDALAVVVRRMDNRDLEQVALVAKLQREMGGNAAEVVDRVTETVRERFELRRLVKTLTAQGRMSRWVVSLLPVGLFLLISLLNPGYFHPLWRHAAGRAMVVAAVLLVLGGSWVIKRIVEIKV